MLIIVGYIQQKMFNYLKRKLLIISVTPTAALEIAKNQMINSTQKV